MCGSSEHSEGGAPARRQQTGYKAERSTQSLRLRCDCEEQERGGGASHPPPATRTSFFLQYVQLYTILSLLSAPPPRSFGRGHPGEVDVSKGSVGL